MNLFHQIMDGETVCPAIIRNHNAEYIMRWVRATDTHHTADECPHRKDCGHAPGALTADFAATVASEEMNACTCGEHGVDDPEAVARIGAAFIERWRP